MCSGLGEGKGQCHTLLAGQFRAGCRQLPLAPQSGAQHPWVQLCPFTPSQSLALGPDADPLSCSKAVASLAPCPSECLAAQALTLWGGVLG